MMGCPNTPILQVSGDGRRKPPPLLEAAQKVCLLLTAYAWPEMAGVATYAFFVFLAVGALMSAIEWRCRNAGRDESSRDRGVGASLSDRSTGTSAALVLATIGSEIRNSANVVTIRNYCHKQYAVAPGGGGAPCRQASLTRQHGFA